MTEEDMAEMRHFSEIVKSFKNYKTDSFNSVPNIDEDKKTRSAIEMNAMVTEVIIADADGMFGPRAAESAASGEDSSEPTAERNVSKVRSTLKQFVREWSAESAPERDQSFRPLIEGLLRHLPVIAVNTKGERVRSFVVCPGSGLGRLPYELAKAGFDAQGNEFSYHMILGANFVLNSPRLEKEAVALFPYCLGFSNCASEKARLRAVRIPDEVPSRTEGQMSMCAGEFVETYEKQGCGFADGLVTSFFIDTAKNVLLYIRTFAGMLRTGGVWANMGPLLFHYAEQDDETSVELSYAELRELVQTYFTIKEEQYPVNCVYSGNTESLVKTEYKCVYFIAERNDVPVTGFSNPVFN